MARLSGPLLDRIAIHVHVHPVDLAAFKTEQAAARDTVTAATIRRARRVQAERFAEESAFMLNATMPARLVRRHCELDDASADFLYDAHRKLRLSARGRGHILRVARTIADLEGVDGIARAHVGEAIQYRSRELGRR